MYYFLKKENFNLDKYDFDVNINPRFTKKELKILKVFLKFFKVEEEYTEVDFSKKYFDCSLEELKKAINKINKKAISIYIYQDGKELTSLYFNIFDIVVFQEEKIIYKLSEELRLSYGYGNFFSRIRILTIIQFQSNYSYKFFKLVSKSIFPQKEIVFEVSLEELRDKLGITEGVYERFYDFERKIINPILKDVESFSPHIYYEKIKSRSGKGSKIIALKFHIINPFHIEVNRDTNLIIKEYNSDIEDFSVAYKKIYSYRKTHSLEETREFVANNLDEISNE